MNVEVHEHLKSSGRSFKFFLSVILTFSLIKTILERERERERDVHA